MLHDVQIQSILFPLLQLQSHCREIFELLRVVEEKCGVVYLYLDTGSSGRLKSEICIEFVRQPVGTVQCEHPSLHYDTVAWNPFVRDVKRYW